MRGLTVEEARAYYTGSDGAHDFDHVLRVLALAERIGKAEGADMEVLRAAALLHDLARAEEMRGGPDHAQAGAQRAREVLAHWPKEKAEAVVQAIAAHRFRGKVTPQTLEAKILYDADKLDSIGAIGIARAYILSGGLDDAPLEFEVKLKKVKDTLFTETAKAMAEERHRYMMGFFSRLKAEEEGRA